MKKKLSGGYLDPTDVNYGLGGNYFRKARGPRWPRKIIEAIKRFIGRWYEY